MALSSQFQASGLLKPDDTTAPDNYHFPSFFFFLIFIYLAVLGLSCGMWDPVPWSGVEPRPPALGARSLSHWTAREVPAVFFINVVLITLKFTKWFTPSIYLVPSSLDLEVHLFKMTWGSQPYCTLWIQINSPLALPLASHSLELMILSWAYFFSWELWWVVTRLFSLTLFKWFWFALSDMKWKELWSGHSLLSSSRSLVTDVLMLCYLTHKSSLLVFLHC